MNTIHLIAAAFLLTASPAFAQEGNSNPFAFAASSVTVAAQTVIAAVSSEAYPDTAGRPGSNLAQLADELLLGTASEAVVQTANSLPRGAEVGMTSHAYGQSVSRHFAAQAQRGTPVYATVASLLRN